MQTTVANWPDLQVAHTAHGGEAAALRGARIWSKPQRGPVLDTAPHAAIRGEGEGARTAYKAPSLSARPVTSGAFSCPIG